MFGPYKESVRKKNRQLISSKKYILNYCAVLFVSIIFVLH